MKKLLVPALIVFTLASLDAQNTYKIKGCLDNSNYQEVYLAQIIGSNTTIIDTSLVTNGCFDFYLSDSSLPGMYSIILDLKKNAYIRVLFNRENIVFHSDLNHLLDSMNFTESAENNRFYDYSRFITRNNVKIDLLNRLCNLYATEDKFYKNCKAEIERTNQQLSSEPARIIASSPSTFFAHILKAQQPVSEPDNIDDGMRIKFYREHYLDNIDFTYNPLIGTELLPLVIKKYITFFEQNNFTQKEQELSYVEAIDNLLEKCKSNLVMNDFVVKELIELFRYGNYDIMGAYITEKYMLSNKCEGDPDIDNLKMTIDNIRRVSVGKTAPEIIMKDSQGKTTLLSEYTNDYFLLVFWSTNCSHCTKMLPELRDIYSRCDGNSLKILTYSIDTDREKWNDFLINGNYKWINYNDPLGWQSNTAREYNINATPVFFLLNKEKRIIAKPVDLSDLTEKLRSMSILK